MRWPALLTHLLHGCNGGLLGGQFEDDAQDVFDGHVVEGTGVPLRQLLPPAHLRHLQQRTDTHTPVCIGECTGSTSARWRAGHRLATAMCTPCLGTHASDTHTHTHTHTHTRTEGCREAHVMLPTHIRMKHERT